MISTARMVPVGSKATNPFFRAKIHQPVQSPVTSNINSSPINSWRLVSPGSAVIHFCRAAIVGPLVSGDGVNSASPRIRTGPEAAR